jgi:hypothetical protein
MKIFNSAVHTHVGISGFTNYLPGDPRSQIAAVFQEFPDAIIVDGTDDWGAAREFRPETFEGSYGVKPLAYFHTGCSGISKSGIVITQEDFDSLPESIRTSKHLKIHRKP